MKGIVPKELSYITWKWLKAVGLSLEKSFVEQEITTHPDYPSVISVVSFLDNNRFSYQAVRAGQENFSDMQYPLLAHMLEPDGTPHFTLVHHTHEWNAHSELRSKWSGIVIFPDGQPAWNNKSAIKKFSINQYREFFTLILLFCITSYSAYTISSLTFTLFSVLSLLGLVASWLTYKTEAGYQNQIVKQVCNSLGSSGGCDRVMKSAHAKGILNITPAVAGLGWFFMQWSVLAIAGYFDKFTWIYSVYLCSLSGFMVSIWSVYVQKKIVKQWCALCLGIVAVLILQAIISGWFLVQRLDEINANLINTIPVLTIILITIIVVVIQPLKALLQNTFTTKKLKIELRRWKTDHTIFTNLLYQSEKADCSTWDDEIIIGNPDAAIKITVACNPYCKPCAITHKALERLQEVHPGDVALQIRFALYKGAGNFKYDAVRMILQQLKAGYQPKKLLHDWFDGLGVDTNVQKWKDKYKAKGSVDVENIISLHEKWTLVNGIEFTPTLFINGRKLPGKYSYTDLPVLIEKMLEY